MGIINFNLSNHFSDSISASVYSKKQSSLNENEFAIPKQTHSSNVIFVKKPGIYENVDGLISSKTYKVPLMVKTADCVPIFIFDFKTNYYGIVHSGWRGTKNKILLNALNMLISKFKSNPKNILIALGPHIKKCCYEVDWDVAKYFKNIHFDEKKNKWFLSLSDEIETDILEMNIPNKNFHSSNICTFESDYCQSFRRDGIKSERMIGIIR
tara:strand:+ start:2987 stop:3619 length:633 start_codon:yes stop_codon:yes gene_type:complete